MSEREREPVSVTGAVVPSDPGWSFPEGTTFSPDGRPDVSEARRPDWLKVRLPAEPTYAVTRGLVRGNQLHTVCQSAQCPNIGECWSAGTATVMILGDVCTRSCGFCAVKTGRPPVLDREEPERVAEAIATMDLVHVVITSVDRDELPDGGAAIWAATIEAVRRRAPGTRIEVLTPDFKGDRAAIDVVLAARPDIFAHNIETVERLHREVRPQARYERSLAVLAQAKERGFVVKSSLMLGLGETEAELLAVLRDLSDLGCDLLTLGQYLRPTRSHLPVRRFAPPDEFGRLKVAALALGFRDVESGPLVRSSYHAERAARHLPETAPLRADRGDGSARAAETPSGSAEARTAAKAGKSAQIAASETAPSGPSFPV
ncbi:MAG: lipoyl synthase [Candidatus Eisenbacteria bacterium]|nr:lipoyl synthase [Candidatus Eisenbacteria bacterium]